MTTRAQIIHRLVQARVKRHYIPNLTRAQVKQAAQGFTDAEWDGIIVGLVQNKPKEAGAYIRLGVLRFLNTKAQADVDALLVGDDALTITELQGLL